MEKSSFFNSVAGDRKYDATDWAEYFASFIGNGVFGTPTDCLQIVPDGGMRVAALPGTAWVNGYFYVNTGRLSLQLATADGVLKRIDRIVLRWSMADRCILVRVKQGAASASPTAPSLQRDASVYELCIADMLVENGVTSIVEGNITDRRDDHVLCGIVSSIVGEVHTHDMNDLIGPLGVAKGGTGASTVAGARNALGLGNTNGALPVANGGTGSISAANARTSLGITPGNIGAAPTDHSSTATTYGMASDTLYGHAMATTTEPKPGGTAAVGLESGKFARGDHVHPAQTNVSGNATTATKLQTARSIALSGGAAGTATAFDGTANITIAVTGLNMDSATSGTLPVARGGTGAGDAAAARSSLGITPGNIGAAASSHTHSSSQLSDAVPVTKGGTGAGDATTARNNLGITPGNIGAAAASHTHSSAQLTDAVPIANGGTGASTAAAARNALGLGNTSGALPIANGGTGASDVASARNALGLGYTAGALPIENGGTGSTSAAAARSVLGLGNTTGPVPVAAGGTGATSAKAGMNALGIFYAATLPATGTDGQVCLVPIV